MRFQHYQNIFTHTHTHKKFNLMEIDIYTAWKFAVVAPN